MESEKVTVQLKFGLDHFHKFEVPLAELENDIPTLLLIKEL